MKKALIVGLNKYPHPYELKYCAHDAREMSELIGTNGDDSPNFDVQLVEDSCNNRKLRQKIEDLFKGDADIALLYFSGHGEEKDGGYLVTTDIDFNKNIIGVRMDDVLQWANISHCKNKVIILDCCFSGAMGQSLLVENKSVLGDGVTILSASRSDESSFESFGIGHGVFTDLLLQGLKGGAADISGNITPASLYSFVDQSLGAWQQRPVFKTNISQFLPLRTIESKVPKRTLRKIKEYFSHPNNEYKLDPSYEFTNDQNVEHEIKEPYVQKEHVKIFKDLQLFESVGLVEPVDEEHMYFAAMHSKSCKLTPLGVHYWNLVHDKRF